MPPTEVTSGSEDGQLLTCVRNTFSRSSMKSVGPVSPDAPSTVTWWRAAFLNAPRRLSSDALLWNVSSVAPKLCEITSPRSWSMTKFSAATISGKPCSPSVSSTGVSTSRMFAPGAIACAHSTSSVVSPAQPTMSSSAGSNGGGAPAGVMIFSDGGAGRPKSLSNCARSCSIVGEPKLSTMTMVFPAPFRPAP